MENELDTSSCAAFGISVSMCGGVCVRVCARAYVCVCVCVWESKKKTLNLWAVFCDTITTRNPNQMNVTFTLVFVYLLTHRLNLWLSFLCLLWTHTKKYVWANANVSSETGAHLNL